uniref:Glutamate rich 6 n=1 Tax=Pipistrellus kuhlii TaxID=59472 RepID=A0A7J8A6C1_PIPKU|nr:glutamate rich 6 [Pipistrellus kuhlii]
MASMQWQGSFRKSEEESLEEEDEEEEEDLLAMRGEEEEEIEVEEMADMEEKAEAGVQEKRVEVHRALDDEYLWKIMEVGGEEDLPGARPRLASVVSPSLSSPSSEALTISSPMSLKGSSTSSPSSVSTQTSLPTIFQTFRKSMSEVNLDRSSNYDLSPGIPISVQTEESWLQEMSRKRKPRKKKRTIKKDTEPESMAAVLRGEWIFGIMPCVAKANCYYGTYLTLMVLMTFRKALPLIIYAIKW